MTAGVAAVMARRMPVYGGSPNTCCRCGCHARITASKPFCPVAKREREIFRAAKQIGAEGVVWGFSKPKMAFRRNRQPLNVPTPKAARHAQNGSGLRRPTSGYT